MLNQRINILLFVLAFTVVLARTFLFTYAMPAVHILLLAAKFALVPIALILALRTPGKPSVIAIGVLLYGITILVTDMINHTQVLTFTLLALDVFIIWALFRWFSVRQSLFPLKATTLILMAFIAVNFLLVLWRPDGLWQYGTNGKMYYLLGGNYNNMGKALLVALVCNMMLLCMLPTATPEQQRSKAWWSIVFVFNILLAFATVLFVGSKTSLVGLLLLLAFAVLQLLSNTAQPSPTRRPQHAVPNTAQPSPTRSPQHAVPNTQSPTRRSRPQHVVHKIALLLFIILYFVFQSWAVFRDMDNPSPYAEYIVQDVLHKDMTFTLRTHVWHDTKQLIEQRPIIGFGEHDDIWYHQQLGVLTTHNLVLHILLKGGWVALAAFILLILLLHLRLLRAYRRGNISALFLLDAVWVYLFMMILETYPFASIAVLFFLADFAAAFPPNTYSPTRRSRNQHAVTNTQSPTPRSGNQHEVTNTEVHGTPRNTENTLLRANQ